MAVSRKRKLKNDKLNLDSNENSDSIYLKILDKKYSRHHSVTAVPLEIPIKLTKDNKFWISYNSAKFYPVGFVDGNGELLSFDVDVVEHIVLLNHDCYFEENETSIRASPTNSIYWFSSFKAHTGGRLRVTWSCPEMPYVTPITNTIELVLPGGKNRKKTKRVVFDDISLRESKKNIDCHPIATLVKQPRLTERVALMIKGPVLSLTLTPSLLCIIADDRERVSRGEGRGVSQQVPPSAADVIEAAVDRLVINEKDAPSQDRVMENLPVIGTYTLRAFNQLERGINRNNK